MESVIERVEKLARDGIFGKGGLKNVKNQSDNARGSQFASQIFFLQVALQDAAGKENEIPVVVKIQLGEKQRELSNEVQFANEVAMYDRILPELGAEGLEIAANMRYGLSTLGEDPEADIIIFDDLRHQDFKLAKEIFFDYDHLSLSLRTLGKFHGLSYKIKKTSPEKLRAHANALQHSTYADPDNVFERCLWRGFKELLNNPSYSYLEHVFEKLTSIPMEDTWNNLHDPEEPFATILHGDFNRNNMLFAYESGKVAKVKFIDFGASLYSDPTIDVSFFLYMNTSEEMRAAHWDDLLEEYWKGVLSVELEPGFSFQDFLRNFAKKAIWGYLPCCCFLPMMLYPEEIPDKLKEMSTEEKFEWADNFGGEKATEAITSIARHLADKGYMEEFLRNFTNEARSS